MKSRDTWKFIIQTIAAILTAIATSLGVTSCMSALWTFPISESRELLTAVKMQSLALPSVGNEGEANCWYSWGGSAAHGASPSITLKPHKITSKPQKNDQPWHLEIHNPDYCCDTDCYRDLARRDELYECSVNFALKSAISRQAKVSKLPLVLWLNEIVPMYFILRDDWLGN